MDSVRFNITEARSSGPLAIIDQIIKLAGLPSQFEAVRDGLPVDSIKVIAGAWHVSVSDLITAIHLPPSTYVRRKKSGRLDSSESDRVIRFARLSDLAREAMLDDADAAAEWLNSPQLLLEGSTPLERAGSEVGGREVEQLLYRIMGGTVV